MTRALLTAALLLLVPRAVSADDEMRSGYDYC